MKKILTALIILPVLLGAYSIFNTRGLGCYIPPIEYTRILPRNLTRIEAGFLAEYGYATDGIGAQSEFIVRPELVRLYVPLPGRFGFSAQICEHYNLDFAVQTDSLQSIDYTLVRFITGRGGIDGVRVALDKSFYDIIYLQVGYERLFGGAWEHWDSEILKFNDADSIIFHEQSIDSLLYYFGGNVVWGMAGFDIGPVEVRGFYSYPFGLTISTEVQTFRDTTLLDSAFYHMPVELGGILSYSMRDIAFNLAYIQQIPPTETPLALTTGRLLELSSIWNLDQLTLTGRMGWNRSYALTVDSSFIDDIYLGVSTHIPILDYGWGKIDLSGGLRRGGDISEFHVDLRLGVEFTELWKKRERMWGG